jgi:UDP-glucose 4-epimerase
MSILKLLSVNLLPKWNLSLHLLKWKEPSIFMQNIFLSGGKGFIGRNFIEQCSNRYSIDAPNRSQLELTNQNQVDQYCIQKKFDCIIHAASVGVSRKTQLDPLFCLNANLRAFNNVFKNRHVAHRFIHIGSGAAYGRPLIMRQIDEDSLARIIPEDSYGFAKLLCSQIIATESPQQAVNLHVFGVFGPYEDHQLRFISNAITRTLVGLPIVIKQNVEFDYLYINDFLKIINEFIKRPAAYSNYNITTGQPVTLLEIAEIIREVLGNKQEIVIQESGLGNSYTGSNTRLRGFLEPNFEFTPMKQAIEELAVWYETRLATQLEPNVG